MTAELYPVAILAGGLATRLRPYTETIPKSLVDVNGEPFLAHQLRLLSRQGVRRVVICSGYHGEMIEEYAGSGGRFGLEVLYSHDGETLLGTGGAIRKALPLLGERFFVLYGDSYLECDYGAVQQAFEASGRKALMTVYRNEGRYDASNIEFSGGAILAYDKQRRTPEMRHIDYGLGVFDESVFETVPAGVPCDLAGVYGDLLRRGELAGFEVARRFYEIGSFEGLEEFRRYMGGAE
ncbi:MAG TPA: nucleotidyltransferase family protein [Bryobacteraceae bacterium]|nr:nucleotidyltransferase family protein [Bryobacteraceae bacterium]